MESPSASAHRGHVPWQGLLLAASLLTHWSPPTAAQVAVPSISAAEGQDVLLLVHNLPQDPGSYRWYKGEHVDRDQEIASYNRDAQISIAGPAHSGRETIYDDGSLLLQKVTLNDTGYYTIQITMTDLLTDIATGQLQVYPERTSMDYLVGIIAGNVIGFLILVVLGTALGCFLYIRRTRRATDPRDLRGHQPPASTPGQGPSGASTALGPLPGPRTASPIYEDLQNPSTDMYCRIHPGADGAS